MAIDLENESAITIKAAAALPMLARDGKQPNLATVYRWTMPNGCRGVRLDSIMVGSKLCTSLEAIKRFLGDLQGTRRTRKQLLRDARVRRLDRVEEHAESA